MNLDAERRRRGPANVAVGLVDPHGTFALASPPPATAIPYADSPRPRAAFASRMLRVPFTAKLAMPSRSLDRLPDVLRVDGARGTPRTSRVTIEGTALDPRITLRGRPHAVPLAHAAKSRRSRPS